MITGQSLLNAGSSASVNNTQGGGAPGADITHASAGLTLNGLSVGMVP